MFTWNPEEFASLHKTDLGQHSWEFLTRPESLARLETASQVSKPAVDRIEEQFPDVFREYDLADRVMQIVCHIVRQILEQRDWVLDQSDVKVPSVPFRMATRYRRPDWITFYSFRNRSDLRHVAHTDRRQNPPLPTDAPWTYYATFASPLNAAVVFGVRDIRQRRQHVHAYGFQRVRVERMLRRA